MMSRTTLLNVLSEYNSAVAFLDKHLVRCTHSDSGVGSELKVDLFGTLGVSATVTSPVAVGTAGT